MNLLRHFATAALFACSLVGAGSMNTASAELITYTLTGGTIDGTLNGVPFSGKSFTMMVNADPANFTLTPVFNPPSSLYFVFTQLAAPTMTIDGFSPFTITQSPYELFVVDAGPGLAFAGGFGVFAGQFFTDDFAVNFAPATGDPINGPGSITGDFITTGPTLTTSVGSLVISGSTNAGATFTAASAVPEIAPSCLGSVLALLGGGLGLLERRRKRT